MESRILMIKSGALFFASIPHIGNIKEGLKCMIKAFLRINSKGQLWASLWLHCWACWGGRVRDSFCFVWFVRSSALVCYSQMWNIQHILAADVHLSACLLSGEQSWHVCCLSMNWRSDSYTEYCPSFRHIKCIALHCSLERRKQMVQRSLVQASLAH